jgi:hypothetical protein
VPRVGVLRPRSAALAIWLCTAAIACEPSTTTSTPTGPAPSSGSPPSTTATASATGVDPLVPYSPPPRALRDATTGWAGDTIALPNAVGGTMHVTLVSTAIGPVAGPDGRPFNVWFTIENVEGPPWTGYPGGFVTLTDATGAELQPIPTPTRRELHPDPERYGGSSLDLHKPRTIGPGDAVTGVTLFRVQGGYRPVTIAISFDRGTTWATYATSFGPY